jgi:hypothetical protein
LWKRRRGLGRGGNSAQPREKEKTKLVCNYRAADLTLLQWGVKGGLRGCKQFVKEWRLFKVTFLAIGRRFLKQKGKIAIKLLLAEKKPQPI